MLDPLKGADNLCCPLWEVQTASESLPVHADNIQRLHSCSPALQWHLWPLHCHSWNPTHLRCCRQHCCLLPRLT